VTELINVFDEQRGVLQATTKDPKLGITQGPGERVAVNAYFLLAMHDMRIPRQSSPTELYLK
jgi:hypothetical protein